MLESAPVREGDVLAGKYRIERVLGVGGMGVVVAALHIHLQQRVALKFMLPAALANVEAVGRFVREGRVLARLRSEHVARVIDVGVLEEGAPYIVMEFLDGSDLDAIVKAQGPLPVAVAIGYVLQACEGIAEAHANGLVHRDLKPANLFLTRKVDGQPLIKVLDFGISKDSADPANEPGKLSLTNTNVVLGSPQFMSPEQLKSSRDVDALTDVWALGACLYALLSGALPFDAPSFVELSAKVLADEPRPLRDVLAGVPPKLEEIVFRCLEKDRADRFADVGALAVALEPFALEASRGSAERIANVLRAITRPRVSLMPAAVDVDPMLASDPTMASSPALGVEGSLAQSRALSKGEIAHSAPHGGSDTGLVVTLEGRGYGRRRARVWAAVGIACAIALLLAVVIRTSARGGTVAASPVSASATTVAAPVEPAPNVAQASVEDGQPAPTAPVVGTAHASQTADPAPPKAKPTPKPTAKVTKPATPKSSTPSSPEDLLLDRN